MVRETDRSGDANTETTTPPGRGLLTKAADTLRDLVTDPPHDPDTPPLGRAGFGLEWK